MDTLDQPTVVSTEKTPVPGSGLASLPPKPQDRYTFLRSIGFGGMKCVLLVYDRDTDREVAMALMPDFRERTPEELEQFVHEARLTASLEHPNIVAVHDLGTDRNGAPFYTMAYLRGTPLSIVLKRLRKHSPKEESYYTVVRRIRIFLRVCNAVTFAHDRNICHLDIKPSNVNVGEYGEVRLLDWGLACKTDENGAALRPRGCSPQGTPGYMAPEQISTNPDAPPVGKSSDIYALGALLYSMFALSSPFGEKPNEELLRLTMFEKPPKLSKAVPRGTRIPPELDQICARAMAKDPAARYASVAEMRHALQALQNRVFQSGVRRRGRQWLILLMLFGAILAAAILLFYLF